jgi:hypothetical protein
MEKLSIGTSSHLIDDAWLKIKEDGPGHVFASSSLTEERVEGIIAAANSFI